MEDEDEDEEEYVEYSDDSGSDQSDLDEMADFNHRETSAFSTVSSHDGDQPDDQPDERSDTRSVFLFSINY